MNNYERRKYERWKKEEEKLMGKGPLAKLLEYIILFVVCSYLLQLGVNFILAVKIPLITIALTIFVVYVTVKAIIWRRNRNDF